MRRVRFGLVRSKHRKTVKHVVRSPQRFGVSFARILFAQTIVPSGENCKYELWSLITPGENRRNILGVSSQIDIHPAVARSLVVSMRTDNHNHRNESYYYYCSVRINGRESRNDCQLYRKHYK